MSKHIAVYMINLRRVIYKVLLIVAIMCVAEAFLLYNGTKYFFEFADGIYIDGEISQSMAKYQRSTSLVITDAFADSKTHLVFMVAFIAVCIVFIINGLELGGSKSRYTVHRLSINGKLYVLWESMAYLTCLVIFYAAQIAMSAGFVALYDQIGGLEYYSSQAALIMFYENDFLHSLLPLRDMSRMIRNIVMMLSLAVCAGCFAYHHRQERKAVAVFVVAAIIVFDFPLEMGRWGTDVSLILLLLTIAVTAVVNLWRLANES